jgi:serine protease
VSTYTDTEPTDKVTEGILAAGTPTITGKAAVGQTLSVETGTWTDGTTLEYQWLADGNSLGGASGPTLVLGPDLAGKALTVRVVGAKPGYLPASRTSQPTAGVAVETAPTAVIFTDKSGTKDDTYTIPNTTGVDYVIAGSAVSAGTYAGAGTIVVYPLAHDGFFLASSTPAFWGTTFASSPYMAYASDITFTDVGQQEVAINSYIVPVSQGVDYMLDGEVLPAGTYPGKGTMTITASPRPDFFILPLGKTSWTHTFPVDLAHSEPTVVGGLTMVPPAVVFVDEAGTASDTYTVPVASGVDYLVGGQVLDAGTYKGVGTVTVTARAQSQHALALGATTSWTATFRGSLVGPGACQVVCVSEVESHLFR